MKRDDDPYRETLADVAEWFGLSKSAVEEWNLDDGAPKKTRRGYNCRLWAVWLAKRKHRSAPKDSPDYRLKQLRVEEKEFELARMKGEFVTVKQHNDQRMAIVDLFTRALERLPAEAAPKVAGKTAAEARKALDEWQQAAREEIAESNGSADA